MALINGLPDTSAFAAERAGGPEHRGWGVDRHIAANHYDLTLTAAMGQGGKKPKKDQLHPRPGRKAKGRRLTDLIPGRPRR